MTTWRRGGTQARTEEALDIITRLLNGETVTKSGRYFRAERARLYDLPPRRVPVIMSAFGPQAAAIAGRLADGVWTLAHPVKAPKVIAAYRKAAEEAGRPHAVAVMNVSAADPLGMIKLCGEQVLPELRG